MPKRGKQHPHYIVGYETKGRTNRGNPNYYLFTLDCGHVLMKSHSINVSMKCFVIAVILPSKIKKGETIKKKDLPKIHCYHCARGDAHTDKATDIDKLLTTLNEQVKKAIAELKKEK